MIENLRTTIEGYELSEIGLSLTITGKGELSIILANVEVTASSCINLKIIKKPPSPITKKEDKLKNITTSSTSPTGEELTKK